jgi:hypothetical protein
MVLNKLTRIVADERIALRQTQDKLARDDPDSYRMKY